MSDLRAQLQEIHSTHGTLTPTLVVEEARDEISPLHGHFDWNDTTAGESWRREQARHLIKSVRITYSSDGEAQSVRAFQAINRKHPEPVYEPSEKIAADPALRQLVILQMEREWGAMFQRYSRFREFAQLVAASMENAA